MLLVIQTKTLQLSCSLPNHANKCFGRLQNYLKILKGNITWLFAKKIISMFSVYSFHRYLLPYENNALFPHHSNYFLYHFVYSNISVSNATYLPINPLMVKCITINVFFCLKIRKIPQGFNKEVKD